MNYLKWDKIVQTLDQVLSIASRPGHCPNRACPGHALRLISAQGQGIAPANSTYGYSRPVVESRLATLMSRGAGELRYKGHEGAVVQMGMTVMAHNRAVFVRIRQQRLSKRG